MGDRLGTAAKIIYWLIVQAYATLFQESLTLYLGRNGELHKVDEFCMLFKEQPNVSTLRFENPAALPPSSPVDAASSSDKRTLVQYDSSPEKLYAFSMGSFARQGEKQDGRSVPGGGEILNNSQDSPTLGPSGSSTCLDGAAAQRSSGEDGMESPKSKLDEVTTPPRKMDWKPLTGNWVRGTPSPSPERTRGRKKRGITLTGKSVRGYGRSRGGAVHSRDPENPWSAHPAPHSGVFTPTFRTRGRPRSRIQRLPMGRGYITKRTSVFDRLSGWDRRPVPRSPPDSENSDSDDDTDTNNNE